MNEGLLNFQTIPELSALYKKLISKYMNTSKSLISHCLKSMFNFRVSTVDEGNCIIDEVLK